jgi:hypothetical protein
LTDCDRKEKNIILPVEGEKKTGRFQKKERTPAQIGALNKALVKKSLNSKRGRQQLFAIHEQSNNRRRVAFGGVHGDRPVSLLVFIK